MRNIKKQNKLIIGLIFLLVSATLIGSILEISYVHNRALQRVRHRES
jgi:predicted membrane protein